MTAWFFGYGSLVNRATHSYPQAQRARLHNWRRIWVRTAMREVVFLSIHPAPDHEIDGLIATVPNANWTALDARETGYDRVKVTNDVENDVDASHIAAYRVTPEMQREAGKHFILLSYLDTVAQGFREEFGPAGVEAFFATTDGWDAPVFDDRGSPRYPRACDTTHAENAQVDRLLAQVQ
ncbi:gamma-glutamylcyclotransferase [Tateyamaria sp.]|nr:gamma-glutamylcyclotransferase [Tateyamaria sp.]